MFDRFDDAAREVMGASRQEAQRLCHDFIGPEHMLLGIVRLGRGIAVEALKRMGVDLGDVRRGVEREALAGNSMVTMGQLPFTPRGCPFQAWSVGEMLRIRSLVAGNRVGRDTAPVPTKAT